MPRRLTAADVCQVTGYSREELRALRERLGLPRPPKARVAQEFTRPELLVFAAIYDLESRFGLKRGAILQIFKPLKSALSGPRLTNPDARLLITLSPPTVAYLERPSEVTEGILMPLQPVFDRVDSHIGGYAGWESGQRDLKLPGIVSPKQTKTTWRAKR